MNFFSYVDAKRPAIKKHIEGFLSSKKNAWTDSFFTHQTYDNISQFATTGKLLRGVFVLLSYEMFSKIDDEKILNAAAAIELTHSSLLVHDDIVDNDTLRRGAASIHARYTQLATETNSIHNPINYGVSMGLFVGDIGFFLAFELLTKSCRDSNTLSRIINTYCNELYQAADAQLADIHYGQSTQLPTNDQILRIYQYKTGRYTFSLPFMIGAILAKASVADIERLAKWGQQLGVVFQLVDDLIGLTGTVKQIGKPIGSDIKENKKTYIRQLLFQDASANERVLLNKIFGGPYITDDDIASVIKLVSKYRIQEKVMETARTLTQKAKQDLRGLAVSESYLNLLNEIAHYNLSRIS